MARTKSSSQWLRRHVTDPFVKQAQKDGYRSRSAYKLTELDQRDKLFRPGMQVMDLGAAPGGWSQVAAKLVGHEGRVHAVDLLPMDGIAGVDFILGDFTQEEILQQLLALIDNRPVDLVISDMAPNLSGSKAVDQPASLYLVELALDLACKVMKPEGVFITKIFQGEGFDEFVRHVRTLFNTVSMRKPDASRAKSREVYMVAKGLKA